MASDLFRFGEGVRIRTGFFLPVLFCFLRFLLLPSVLLLKMLPEQLTKISVRWAWPGSDGEKDRRGFQRWTALAGPARLTDALRIVEESGWTRLARAWHSRVPDRRGVCRRKASGN